MARANIVLQDGFDFGGHSFFVQFKELDGDDLDQIIAQTTGIVPNHFLAQSIAIRRTVHSLKMDGKEVSLKPKKDGSTDFPKVVDMEAKETLQAPLLRYIVSFEKTLPILAEDTFGEYAESEGPTTPPSTPSSQPYQHTPAATIEPSEYQSE